MKKQIRNALLVVAALLLVVLFYFLPNIQAALVDKKTFGQSEDLSLNPVEISVEATQTTLEKLKIINNHILSVAVRPSSRTVDGRDVEKTAKKQTNLLLKKMKIAYRVDEDWKITYKKLYTYIKKKDDDLKGKMASQGTTPRRLTDLIGSLCDLTSGSGDKGTPIIYIQGYFDNYTN